MARTTQLVAKDSRTSGWLIPVLIPSVAVSLPGAASPRAAPPGIPAAGFVLKQEFEGVIT
jgi:hypothetical protein